MDWLSATLAEYKAVWDEKMATMDTQQSTLRIGTAIVGAMLVAGLNLWEKPILPEFILLFLVPAVSYLSLIIWMGELQRMVRCKIFLAALEQSINKALSDAPVPLMWESWLRRQQEHKYPHILKWNYRAVLVIFLLIAIASVALGLYKLSTAVSTMYVGTFAAFEFFVALGVGFWYVRVVRSFYKTFSHTHPGEPMQPAN
jgi:hypothetical protein